MNYVFIIANYAAFLIAKNAAPLLPFLLHSKLPKVVYSDLPITPFLCRWTGGSLAIAEHVQAIWISLDELKNYDWAEADVPVVKEITS